MGGNMAAKMEAFHCGASSSSTGETEAAAAVRGEQPPPPFKTPSVCEFMESSSFSVPVPPPQEAVNSNSNTQKCRASQKRSISAE